MLFKLAAITGNTLTETIRQPVFGVLLWVSAAWLAINPSLSLFSLQSGLDRKIMQDVGLSTLLLFGLLASVFSAAGVVSREIENRTVLTVVSKPVGRVTFVLGKYLGVAGAVLIGFYFLVLVFLMTCRHGVLETVSDPYDVPVWVFGLAALAISLIAATFGNYVYGWHFPTALLGWVIPLGSLALLAVLCISPKWELQRPDTDFGDMQIVYAVTLIFLAVLVLSAFAVAFSTRFGQVPTLLLCSGVFLLGLLSDYFVGRHLGDDPHHVFLALYAIVPNFQFFWVADALTQEYRRVDWQHVARVLAYAGLYVPAVLGVGVAMFQTREVG